MSWQRNWEELNRVKINNWANGWEINQLRITNDKLQMKAEIKDQNNTPRLSVSPSQEGTIYIIFWPQALQFLGFGMLGGLGIWILRYKK